MYAALGDLMLEVDRVFVLVELSLLLWVEVHLQMDCL